MTGCCSLPGCDREAVLSWQRVGTDAEAQAYADGLTAQLQGFVDAARVALGLEVEDLQARLERLQSPEPGRLVTAPMLATVQAQLDMRLADLDALVDAVPVPVEPVAVLVLGCAEHAVDGEAGAVLHGQDCLAAGPCGCPAGQ